MNRAAAPSRNEPVVTFPPVGERPDAVLVDVVVLTPDTGLYQAVRAALGERNPVWRARSADEAAELLVSGRCGVLLIDLAAASSRAPELIQQVVSQFPDVVVCVAGTRADEPALAPLISDGLVYRFMHKPASARRAGMFLQAATRRHAELRAGRAQAESLLPMLQRLHRESGLPRRYLAGLGVLSLAAAVALFVDFGGETKSPTTTPAPAVASVGMDRSDPFLARARASLQAGRLEAPRGRNALDLYHAVLLAEPDHAEAGAGLARTVAAIMERAERHADAGRLQEARRLTGRVLAVAPAAPAALALAERLADPVKPASPPQRVADAVATLRPAAGPVAATPVASQPAPVAPAATKSATTQSAAPGADSASNPRVPGEARPDPLTPRYVNAAPESAGDPPPVGPRAYGAPIRDLPTVAPTTAVATAVESAPFSSGAEPLEMIPVDEFDRVYAKEPAYPTEALRNGTTGWVEVAFTITPTGWVSDVAVLDAEPAGVFEAAATEAVTQWRFRPRIVNGVALPQRSTLTFRFDVGG